MFKKIILLLIIIVLSVESVYGEEQLQLNAKSAILIDELTGRVLYEKNSREKMANASTTKIMTCIVALEYGDIESVAEVSGYAASMPDVQLGMRQGEKYYIKDLLYSLMLQSHNDSAVAIAEAVGGDVEGFAKLMNEKAKSIGANDTNFVTPNGLDNENHFTTAYDLALISRYAMKNKKFVEIINTPEYSFSEINTGKNFSVNNKNAFLYQMSGAVGIKTGFTGNAGYCFAGAVHEKNKKFISVVLASGWPPHKEYKWADTKKLMNYGMENYEYRMIYRGSDFKEYIEVKNGVRNQAELYAEGVENILMRGNEKTKILYNYPKETEAPIHKNQTLGNIEIYIDGEIYKSYYIKSRSEIEKRNFKWEFITVFRTFLLDFLQE